MAGGAGGGGIASGTVLATHHHQVSAYGTLCHARLPLVALCSRRLSSAPARPDCSDRTCHVKSRWQAMAGGGGGGGIGSGTVPATHHRQVSTCGALCHARLPLGRAVLLRPVWCTSCSDCDSNLTSRWQATAGGGGAAVLRLALCRCSTTIRCALAVLSATRACDWSRNALAACRVRPHALAVLTRKIM